MPLSAADIDNFLTLQRAVRDRNCLLLECQDVASGQPVSVLCGVERHDDTTISLVPLARLFPGNPYELVNPPRPDGPGFYAQPEVWGLSAG